MVFVVAGCSYKPGVAANDAAVAGDAPADMRPIDAALIADASPVAPTRPIGWVQGTSTQRSGTTTTQTLTFPTLEAAGDLDDVVVTWDRR